MPYNAAQKQATNKYRQTTKRVDVILSVDQWPLVQEYASAKGLTPGQAMKACLFRCMEQDGFTAQEGASTQASTQCAVNVPGMQENATGL